MSRFLILACFIPFYHSAKCQFNQEPFGHYYDLHQNLLLHYLDVDYEPASTLNKIHRLSEGYRMGYYYDLEGNKIEKEIHGSYFDSGFSYKVPDKKKDGRISADKCLGLVIEQDSFAIMKGFQISSSMGNSTVTTNRFVHVIDHIPGYVFYRYLSSNYLYLPKDGDTPIPFPVNKKKFALFCQEYFSDFPLISSLIADEKITEENALEVIRIIDYQTKYNRGEKIYFDRYWNERKDSANHEFYAMIDDLKEGLWHLSYFDKKSSKIFKGSYSLLSSLKKEGTFEWYGQNGKVRKRNTYPDGELQQQELFYENGEKHYVLNLNDDDEWRYLEIYDKNGKPLLNENGSGVERYADVANDRNITKQYQSHVLISAYYTDEKGRDIYQVTEKNTELKQQPLLADMFSSKLEYENDWVEDRIQGQVLLKVIISPEGFPADAEVIFSPDGRLDYKIRQAFVNAVYGKYPNFKPAKSGQEKVYAEIVIPVNIKIHDYYPSYYHHDWMWLHHQHMMMNNVYQVNPANAGPPGF